MGWLDCTDAHSEHSRAAQGVILNWAFAMKWELLEGLQPRAVWTQAPSSLGSRDFVELIPWRRVGSSWLRRV
jgi:hypothetical protein